MNNFFFSELFPIYTFSHFLFSYTEEEVEEEEEEKVEEGGEKEEEISF